MESGKNANENLTATHTHTLVRSQNDLNLMNLMPCDAYLYHFVASEPAYPRHASILPSFLLDEPPNLPQSQPQILPFDS